jgi:flagellin
VHGAGVSAVAGDAVTGATTVAAVYSSTSVTTGTTSTASNLSVSAEAAFTGSIVIANPNASGGSTLVTFVMGGTSTDSGLSSNGQTYTVDGSTLSDLATAVSNTASLGLSAAAGSSGLVLTSTTAGNSAISISSNTLVDTQASASLTYTGSTAYSTGISGSIADTTTGQTSAALVSEASIIGVATISYTDSAGQSLSGTDLSNQTDAKTALTALNAAITDVAAQDGYIGAQINTLDSISQVMTTQKENVVSAQNAIQATDYASATSNMSKYEILSQTGIAALAQANSVQQEVTKLLQ